MKMDDDQPEINEDWEKSNQFYQEISVVIHLFHHLLQIWTYALRGKRQIHPS